MQPGVYWFLDENDKILYVGKAKALRKRLQSYKRIKQLPQDKQELVQKAKKVRWEILESELEALFIEAELIRSHQPQYNILLKDDKTPLYVHISKAKYPTVDTIRKKEIPKLSKKGTIIGPFQSSYKLKTVLRLVRPIFPWCNKAKKEKTKKACFYYHLDLCPGACTGEISREDYAENIKQLTQFLKGKSKELLKDLKKQMKLAANERAYEKAALLRDRVKLIEEVIHPKFRLSPDMTLPRLQTNFAKEALVQLRRILRQNIDLPVTYPLERVEGYDVSNTQGSNASVAMVVFTNGETNNSEYRLFNIRTLDTPNDYHMMKEALLRRQNHPEWQKPNLVLIDGGKGQLRAALQVWQWPGVVISIAKNPDRIIIPKTKQSEKDKQEYAVVKLASNHPALQLLQQVRDESHRFSKKQHLRRQVKDMLH